MAFKQSLCELFTQPGATIAIFASLAAISPDIALPALSLFGFFELRDLLRHVADSRLILPLYAGGDLTFLGSEADRAARNRLRYGGSRVSVRNGFVREPRCGPPRDLYRNRPTWPGIQTRRKVG